MRSRKNASLLRDPGVVSLTFRELSKYSLDEIFSQVVLTSSENFKPKLCTCAIWENVQSFSLKSPIVYFRDIIFEG